MTTRHVCPGCYGRLSANSNARVPLAQRPTDLIDDPPQSKDKKLRKSEQGMTELFISEGAIARFLDMACMMAWQYLTLWASPTHHPGKAWG